MFVMTMTKRRLLRVVTLVLVLITGAAIGIFAVLSCVDTKAESVKTPIYCVDRADNKISLTFDCAWGNSNTDMLISILEQAGVKATFFVTGEFCDKYPDDVKKLYDAGHEIANHSDTHPHLKGMNVNDLIADTKECSRKIEMITGASSPLYRAPYGEYDDKSLTTLEGMDMKVIQWNVDSIDWDKPSPETIIERTTKNIASGSILLFHNDLENTSEALPKVLESLIGQGFEPVKVSELIYADNYTIDGTGKQIKLEESTSTIVYSSDPVINSAFEALADGFTREDVDRLEAEGMSEEMAQRAEAFLTEEQIVAIETLYYEDLLDLFAKLKSAVYAKEDGSQTDMPEQSDGSEQSGDGEQTEAPAQTDGDVIAQTDRPAQSTAQTSELPTKDGAVPAATSTAQNVAATSAQSTPESTPESTPAPTSIEESASPDPTDSGSVPAPIIIEDKSYSAIK